MNIHDVGKGPVLVVVPGLQGRWEWMRPGIDALARHFRVVTFSLADEPTSGFRPESARGFNRYVDQIAEAMDARQISSAAICGMSYGGLIAATFAARHPERTEALVLISAIGPNWQMNARARFYLRAPRLLFPIFALSSLRLVREICTAHGTLLSGLSAGIRHGWNVLTHPGSAARMARRVRLLAQTDLAPELSRLNVRTLVITGDDELDDVVPTSHTREYLTIWPHATGSVLARTGHLGFMTRPGALAQVIERFVAGDSEELRDRSDRRKIG